MLRSLLIASVVVATASASAVIQLTDDNYTELTNDKTVFLKMFAPWVS
jgi:hypothetical protein